jgi:hypothetical protein
MRELGVVSVFEKLAALVPQRIAAKRPPGDPEEDTAGNV